MNLNPSTVAFLAGLGVYLGIRSRFQRASRTERTVVHRSSRRDMSLVAVVGTCQVVLPLVLIFSSWLDGLNYAAPAGTRILGAMLLCAGLWLFWRSHADLGKSWSVTLELRENHRLVTSGVYRFIRHPMYASFFLLAAAQGFLLNNWLAGWSAAVAVLLLYVVRVPAEEAMMLGSFGAEYRSYVERTGGLVPRRHRARSA
jgi:protein-S-isoprenylcysteine O-methyltransferase Ste14